MDHLRLNLHHFARTMPAGTSPAFDAFAAHREAMPDGFLTKVLDAGWLTQPQELNAEHRTVLLAYLGTFDDPAGHSSDKLPDPDLAAAFNNVAHVQGAPRSYVDLALRLLDQGVDPWVRDVDGRDSLDQAFSLQWWPLLERLWQDPARPAAADLMQRTRTVGYVRSPASLHRPFELPWLHAAVALGRETLVERLLDSGFDVQQLDAKGRTALFYAPWVSTVDLLIRRGVDVTVTDQHGRHVGLHWCTPRDQDGAMGLRSEDLAVMNKRLKPAMDAQTLTDPDAARRLQLPVLFEYAATNTKDNVVRHLRDHGLSVNERRTVEGREVSLFAEANLAVLRDIFGKRGTANGTAIALHLFERVEDPWFDSVPGVPDVVLGWLAACRNKPDSKYQILVEQALSERYGWDQPGGFVRFLDAFLPMAQRLIDLHQQDADPNGIRSRANPMGLAVAAAEMRAAVQGSTKNPWPAATQGWIHEKNAQGHAYPWVWASIAGDGAMGSMTTGQAHLIEDNLKYWATDRLPGGTDNRDPRYTSPVVPFDSMALHALLVHLGHTAQPGSFPARTYDGSLLDCAFVNALNRGATLDSSLPGFEDRMARVRTVRPELARELETRMLRQEVRQAVPRAPARPRSRL